MYIKQTFQKTEKFSSELFLTLTSIFRIIATSNFNPSYKQIFPKRKKCIVIGNGPSATSSIQKNLRNLKDFDLIVMNDFVKNRFFHEIKPSYYIIADPQFFSEENALPVQERVDFIYDSLNKIEWKIILLVPKRFEKKTKSKILNENVLIHSFNSTTVNGFQFFSHWSYKKSFGMPRVQNVMIASLMIALNLGYKKIKLWGAEHSWTKYIIVNATNQVCLQSHHFYDQGENAKPWYKIGNEVWKMHEVLRALAFMFEGYAHIEKYAKTLKAQISNETEDSLIDSFIKKPSNYNDDEV